MTNLWALVVFFVGLLVLLLGIIRFKMNAGVQ